MTGFLEKMGPLRLMLTGLALLTIVAMPWADVSLEPEGWGLLRGAVLPAAAPLVFMLVMLDLLMCQVLKVGAEPDKRRDLNRISLVYVLMGVLLVVTWLPIFLRATYF